MKHILVTTDLSANSKSAIRFALQLSKQSRARLTFYHAVEVTKPTGWNDRHYAQFRKEKIEEFSQKVSVLVNDVAKENGFKTGRREILIELGMNVMDMVPKSAKKIGADFICMGTRGGGKMKKVLGTVATELMTTSSVPVFVIPQNYRVEPIEDIFYASDFESLKKEMSQVEPVRKVINAQLNVYYYDYLLDVVKNKTILEKKSAAFVNESTHFHFRKMEIDKTLTEHLEAEVKKVKPSLIVLFTKKNRSWFERLFHNSHSQNMAFNSKAPLLIFRKSK